MTWPEPTCLPLSNLRRRRWWRLRVALRTRSTASGLKSSASAAWLLMLHSHAGWSIIWQCVPGALCLLPHSHRGGVALGILLPSAKVASLTTRAARKVALANMVSVEEQRGECLGGTHSPISQSSASVTSRSIWVDQSCIISIELLIHHTLGAEVVRHFGRKLVMVCCQGRRETFQRLDKA